LEHQRGGADGATRLRLGGEELGVFVRAGFRFDGRVGDRRRRRGGAGRGCGGARVALRRRLRARDEEDEHERASHAVF
jgi:hypothetical protein